MRTLKVSSGSNAGQTTDVEQELVIGREDADLTIDDSEMSRRHVAVRPTERGVEVEDLGSTNGTFVNGERIDGVEHMTTSGTLRVGLTTFEVELTLPELTRAHQTPAAPDVTAPRGIVGGLEPDVTAPRGVPEPDVTAPRGMPEPDVTAPRGVPEPDVTAPRRVPEPLSPDVTAPRRVVQGPAAPDVTAPRRVSERPPEVTPPPPEAPPRSSEDRGGGSGPGRRPLMVAAAALAAVIVVAAVLAFGGGGTEERKVDLTLEVGAVTPQDARVATSTPGRRDVRMTFAGQVSGQPFGTGNVTLSITRKAKRPRRPIELVVTPVFRFDGGTFKGSASANQIKSPPGSLRFQGKGRMANGTGDFEGLEASIELLGNRPRFSVPIEKIRVTGLAEY